MMIKILTAAIAALVITGCAGGLAERAIRASGETLDAIGDARREVIVRRQDLRSKTRAIEDIVIEIHTDRLRQARSSGDIERAAAAASDAMAAIDAATPDLVKFIERLRTIDAALDGQPLLPPPATPAAPAADP